MRRTQLIKTVIDHEPRTLSEDCQTSVDWWEQNWAKNVFSDEELRKRVPHSIYKNYKQSLKSHSPLSTETANAVANAMKDWAIAKGATHFTHWFQPLHVSTAEKHESFIAFTGGDKTILKFDGAELIRGEADASSFPNGGIRTTFRARGYTIWDPSSPAFIRCGKNGSTLMIPALFCSWTGDALDVKTPLIRSTGALSNAAKKLLHIIDGNEKVEQVHTTLGPEQEFFVIDRSMYVARPDLVFTGRTVLGAKPPKGQEMEDHYFGTMPPRILAFIQDVEKELWKLGIPTKSRHNEVAPAQHEMAPIFELANVASDHNMLMMDLMREVAQRHGLAALLHEKPFAGVNGSGKHNNWSMSTDSGENLLEPGDNPAENFKFLAFLAITIKAVDDHAGLLRAAIATPGNDHRLGANEAPPAIMSVYLGSELDALVERIVNDPDRDGISPAPQDQEVKLGGNIAAFKIDSTDRNRTSPFAFTGNKFEFRAVGSSQAVGHTCAILNTIVAHAITEFTKELVEVLTSKGADQPMSVTEALKKVIKSTLTKHKRIVYNGNGYSDKWVKIAEERGLPNFRECVAALDQFEKPENVKLFADLKVLLPQELGARSHVWFHNYCNSVRIEAEVLLQMVNTIVVPAAVKQQQQLADSVASLLRVLPANASPNQLKVLKSVNENIEGLLDVAEKLKAVLDNAKHFESKHAHKLAKYMRDFVKPLITAARERSDALEEIVDDDLWALPKYSDMLFLK